MVVGDAVSGKAVLLAHPACLTRGAVSGRQRPPVRCRQVGVIARSDAARRSRISTADDLLQRFVNAPELGASSFTEKLGRQLADAPQETIQLAAELVYLHPLAPNDFGGTAKRDLLLTALALAPEPIQIPAELDAALDTGFGRAGTAYRTYRDRQLAWLVRFVVAWKALPPDAQQNALKDPWAFRDIADSIPVNSAYSQRNVLLHLAFPDTFERIVSRRHKQLIIEGLTDDPPHPTGDEDRDLAALRAGLERQRGDHIDFYDSEIERRWPPRAASGDGEPELRGWLVRRANVHGRNLVPEWLAEGYCSLAYPDLGELPTGRTRSQIDAQLAEKQPDLTSKQRSIHVGVLDRFLNQMQPATSSPPSTAPRSMSARSPARRPGPKHPSI